MNGRRRRIGLVAALIGVAPLACGKGEGAKMVEAGAPSSAAEAGGPSSHAEAGAPSGGATCGGGAKAVAHLDALPAAAEGGADSGMASPIAGTATFSTTPTEVDLSVSVTGCVNGDPYPVIIHEGAACTSALLQDPEWDAPRGEGILGLTCTGNSGVGLLYYARPSSDPKPWSVGGPSSSDVIGHVLVIHDPATMQPLACGTIAAAPEDADASTTGGPVPSALIRAQLAGLCLYRTISPTGQCPDPETLAGCACTHCDLSTCLSQCSDYVTCLEGEPDAGCASSCSMDATCAACGNDMLRCLLGFCPDAVECAVPTPGGPCSQVEACCARQGPRAQQCLGMVEQIAKLGGDTSCIGTMHDWDFLTHEAYDPPCDFDDAGVTDAGVMDAGMTDAPDAPAQD
jgi:hypothetical protein